MTVTLKRFRAGAARAIRSVLLDGAEAIAANARARVLALKDTDGPSRLADGIRVEETEEGAMVIAGAPYAPYVEFGTRRQAAQPFLAPALEEERQGIIERAGRILGGGA